MASRFLFQRRKAQFAIEFIVLFAVMFVVFIGVTALVADKVLDAKQQERKQIAQDLALLAQGEVDLARSVSDGYFRTFSLPRTVAGIEYNISIIDNRELVVSYLDQEYIVFLQENIFGSIQAGSNNISKRAGSVYLNS